MQTYQAEQEYLADIKENYNLTIREENNLLIIIPKNNGSDKIPIIYYPGGLVSPEAYLYKMGRAAVSLQTTVYIIRAPFNAAIFNVSAAGRVIENYGLQKAWVGGHSLGGISACRFVAGNPKKVYGLFVFGSYCDRAVNQFEGPVISVMGKRDQIIDWENYRKAQGNLPLDATVLEIEGLNHSDFGNYGLQDGDGKSSLGNDKVIEIITAVFER